MPQAAGGVHLGNSLIDEAWALWAATSPLPIAAGVAHLGKSLKAEAGALSSPVGIHTLSPGMVLTDLLLDGATYANKQIFNILCEQVGHCCAIALQALVYVCPFATGRCANPHKWCTCLLLVCHAHEHTILMQ